MTGQQVALILVGGGTGALARYGIVLAQARWTPLPGWAGVLIANLLGCLVIGVAVGSRPDDPWMAAAIMAGFCGALTTFSSFAIDLAFLSLERKFRELFVCIGLSLGAGIPLVALGAAIGRWIG